MTMESQIFEALRGLVSDRVFPDVAPANTVRPYVTYQSVGGEAINFVEGAIPDLENARVQINVWADTRLGASALGKQVENAMRGAAMLRTTVLGARVSQYEPDTGLRGTIQDFSLWY